MCMPVCARGLAIPGYCFDEMTTVNKLNDEGIYEKVVVRDLMPGDLVLTQNVTSLAEIATEVTGIQLIEAENNFTKIVVQSAD
mmetsp:Transcript_9803/g.8364  ORF Transcript_9803/g.8364 Transcript_9803/m.8364 type:complete len:83 (+) Transcript_9803:195-443(+)